MILLNLCSVFLDWYAKNEKPKERLYLQGVNEGAAFPKGVVPSKQEDTFIFFAYTGDRAIDLPLFSPGPGCSKLGWGNPGLVQNLNWDMKA